MTGPRLRALRGATTIAQDDAAAVVDGTADLLRHMLEVNEIAPGDIVSIFFTATVDITAEFPAAGARAIGLHGVPLLCASEMAVEANPARCIRVLMHLYSEGPELTPVYLRGAAGLRPDLAHD